MQCNTDPNIKKMLFKEIELDRMGFNLLAITFEILLQMELYIGFGVLISVRCMFLWNQRQNGSVYILTPYIQLFILPPPLDDPPL